MHIASVSGPDLLSPNLQRPLYRPAVQQKLNSENEKVVMKHLSIDNLSLHHIWQCHGVNTYSKCKSQFMDDKLQKEDLVVTHCQSVN